MVQHAQQPGQELTMAQALADAAAAAAANQQSANQRAGASSATIIPNSQIPPPLSGPSQLPLDSSQPPPGAQPLPNAEHHSTNATPEALEALRLKNEAQQIAYEMEARERRRTHERQMQELQLQEMQEKIKAQQRAAGAIRDDDEATQGEQVSPEVLSLMNKLPGATPRDLSSIVRHKFNPWNLARLRANVGQRQPDQHDVTRIDSVTQQLVLKRSVGSAKDFGSDSSIWLESFINYTRIVAIIWGNKHPEALPAMLSFMSFVVRQSLSYEWTTVLSFAIEYHSRAYGSSILDPTAWEPIPVDWIAHYFNPTTLSNKRPRQSVSLQARRLSPPPRQVSNNKSVICNNFNKINERPNTHPRFATYDEKRQKMSTSPSPLPPEAWRYALRKYPGDLPVVLSNILTFGAQIGHPGFNVCQVFDNLKTAKEDPAVIQKQLDNDLALGRVSPHTDPHRIFASPLGLVPKPDGGWRRIHHLSHPRGDSVNDQISSEDATLKYTAITEIFQLI
ncbi:hypothetical protein EJ04DRAFT_579640 [Polyplosphaeria fusca]|uniref:Uncharacterized protein n=1 Tax=Polyplosphaeria fusca TaxID=682080 RepID=A0A9P4UZ63_9PLEO|nr:hypothetical protein EJ04DRAFT_579640 [Polyplosphaeria fusca]